MRYLLPLVLGLFVMGFSSSPVGVIQQLKGLVNLQTGEVERIERKAELYEILLSDSRLKSGNQGWANIRLVLEQAMVELTSQTSIEVTNDFNSSDSLITITLELGEIRPSIKEKTNRIIFKTRNTSLTETEGRWRFSIDKEGTTEAIVQSGTLVVYNRPKDMTGTVRAGQKAISNNEGLVIIDAEDDELDQFRQNYLEIDFVNPQTEETSTLEIEYGIDF